MDVIAKNLKGGGKTLTYLLAGVFALATTGVWAATEAYWTGGSGGTEAKPLILDSNCYTNSSGTLITPSGDTYHLNYTVDSPTVLKCEVSGKIADCIRPLSGDFTFLGNIRAHVFGDQDSKLQNTKVSVKKKGNWTLEWKFNLGYFAGQQVAFTNNTGSIAVWGDDNDTADKYTCFGYGANSKVDIYSFEGNWNLYSALLAGGGEGSEVSIVKNGGNWLVECKTMQEANREMRLGYGKSSKVSFINNAGNLQVGSSSKAGREMKLGVGESSNVTIEKNAGDWTLYGAMRVANGKNSRTEFYHRGGSLVIANGYGIQMGHDSAGVKSLLEISGGAVTNNAYGIGIADHGQAGSESKLVVKGNGEYYSNSSRGIGLGYRSTGYLNIEDNGRVTASSVTFCGHSGSGSNEDSYLNLNGGTLTTGQITYGSGSANAKMTFNGGTLKALTDGATLIENKEKLTVTVGAGGGTIDTDGKNVTIAKAIGGTGGLTFTGGNTITLNGTIGYTGKTFVKAGTTLGVSAANAGTILANGLELVGVSEPGVYTVLTCSESLADSDLDNVTCGVASEFTPTVDGNAIKVTVTALKPGCWTGAANDGNLSNGSNWSDGNVPTSGNANIFSDVPVTLTKGTTFAPSSITFLEGSAAVTIDGGALSGMATIVNLSSVVQTFANKVEFEDNYRVHCAMQPINFAGGATATCPDPDMTDNAASHTLKGDITFTVDWAQGKVAYPYSVPDGSILHGEDARGTDPTATSGTNPMGDFLSIEAGGKAYFKTVSVSNDKSHINTDGELHVEGVLSITGNSYTHATHNQNDTGVIYAGGIHKCSTSPTYIKVPAIYIGKDGLGAEQNNKMIYFSNDAKTVYATDNFEIFGPCRSQDPSDWGLSLDKQVTFNTQGHTITWTGGANGSGALVKDGEGTLVFNPHGTALSGAVTVKGGTLKVKSAKGVSSGEMTVKTDATLEVAEGATLGSSEVTLEAGSTLALTTADREFIALPNTLNLPTDGKATIRIAGNRLRSSVDHEIATVGNGATSANVELDAENSDALAGRDGTLRIDENGKLLLNIVPELFMIIVR